MKTDITSGSVFLSRKNKIFQALFLAIILVTLNDVDAVFAGVSANLLIQPQQLMSMDKDDRIVIDSRSSWKYFLEHIPGAANVSDWREFTVKKKDVPGVLIDDKQQLSKLLSSHGIQHGKTIVIYGEPSDPWRTDGRIFWMLEYFGFSNVKLLEGGVSAWKEAGGEVERGRDHVPTSNLKALDINFNPAVHADKTYINERLNTKTLAIIDNRTEEEYKGATPYGSQRGGHIPGAIHIDWRDFYSSEGRLHSPETLMNLLKTYGIDESREIVVYCTGGVRSSMAYFVFKYLGYSVRNYDGSWWDWSNDSTLPVENA